MKAFVFVGLLLCIYTLVLLGLPFYNERREPETPPEKLTEYDRRMDFLNKIASTKNPKEIHTTAHKLLKKDQTQGEAVLLLKRNFYTNLFIPSYFALLSLKIPVSISSLVWHFSLFIVSVLCLISLISSIKSKAGSSRHLERLTVLLSLGLALSIGSHLSLKPRLSSFKEMELKITPSQSSSVKSQIRPHSELIVIKKKESNFLVKDENGQTGWVRKRDFFKLF